MSRWFRGKVASSRRVGKSIFSESVVGCFIKHMINNIIEQSLAIKNLNFLYLMFPITYMTLQLSSTSENVAFLYNDE